MRNLLILLVVLIPIVAHADTRAALVVGNSSYQNAPALSNPARDARLVADTLRQLDFAVTRHDNLTRDGFADALDDFLRQNREADVTFFYFAGHGMQYDGRNYLVGTDAELRTELDIDSETIELDKVVELLERNSKAALVFVDACRDNPLATDFYRRNFSETRALETRGLARVRSRTDGSMLVFAAAPGQVAYDGEGLNSPFASALARHLPTEGAEVLSLTKRIIGDVRDATDGQQSPIVTNDLTQEIFLREAALRPLNRNSVGDLERDIFNAARNVATIHSWASYFTQYPSGRFRSEAHRAEHEVWMRELGQLAADWGEPIRIETVSAELAKRFEARLGLTHLDFIATQALLKRAGYYEGPLDGDLGAASRSAIVEFQRSKDLPDNGLLTRRTAAELGYTLTNLAFRPNFSSLRQRMTSIEEARLLGYPDELVSALELLDGSGVIYGFRDDRLYVASTSWRTTKVHYERPFMPHDGIYMASIGSASENAWIYELVRYEPHYWRQGGSSKTMYFGPSIGLFQKPGSREPAAGWVWDSGEEVTFRNWSRSEPSNSGGSEDFSHFWLNGEHWKGTPYLPTGPEWNDGKGFTTSAILEIELKSS